MLDSGGVGRSTTLSVANSVGNENVPASVGTEWGKPEILPA